MLAEGADEILGERIAFIDVAADLADVSLFALGFGLRLHVVLIIGVGHGLLVGKHSRFRYGADEHTVRVEIDVLFNLEGHERVDISGEEYETVVGTERRAILELIGVSAADEAERFKYLEGRFRGQAVDVHDPGLLDYVVRIVGFVDGNGNAIGGVGDLRNRVDDETVVLLAVVGGNDVETVADIEECAEIVFIGSLVAAFQIFAAELVDESVDLFLGVIVQSGEADSP